MARGRPGDYLIENDRIRVIVSDVGRDPVGFVAPYGGHIIDADLVRPPGEPGNDPFMAMSHMINIEGTFNATDIRVINDGSNGGPAIVRATGLDNSLDYINASQLIKAVAGSIPLSVPSSADDVDIPVEIVVDYILNLLEIDTGFVPPIFGVDPAPYRLDPFISNLFSPDFDGLELLIGNDRSQIETFFNENLGDWFNLLNQGLVYVGTSDSDTHHRNMAQAGTFRNFIASSTDSPEFIDEDEMTRSVKEGRSVGGYSPFLRATVHADSTGQTGGLALGLPTIISTTDGNATFHLEMQSPVWVEFDTVQLYINSIPVLHYDEGDAFTTPQYRASPDVVLTAGVDFTVTEVNDHPGSPSHRGRGGPRPGPPVPGHVDRGSGEWHGRHIAQSVPRSAERYHAGIQPDPVGPVGRQPGGGGNSVALFHEPPVHRRGWKWSVRRAVGALARRQYLL
jgi:hypothetical protein